jgi:hypothetical protein
MKADIEAVHGSTMGEILGNLFGEEIKPNLTFSDYELMDYSYFLKKKLAVAGNENPLDVPGIFTLQDGCYQLQLTPRVIFCVSQATTEDGRRKIWLKIPLIERWDKE